MASSESPAWVDAATAAAVRLAAEAGTEVDDILEHAAGASRLTFQITRFEQSADLTEVATDLAGLLWAECEEVPLIATILEEPATQAALQAVAEARRQAARRLAEAANPAVQETPAGAGADRPAPVVAEAQPGPPGLVTAEAEPDPVAPAVAELDDDAFPGLDPLPPLTPLPKAERRTRQASLAPPWRATETSAPAAASPPAAAPAAAAPPAAALAAAAPAEAAHAATAVPMPARPAGAVPITRATRPARAIPTTGNLRPSTGAVLAGTAAAAILLFGRRLRRA